MNNDYKSPGFKKLLDSLQQQSWELELLISGFAIFGLFTAVEPIEIAIQKANNDENIVFSIFYFVALISSYILLFNLLLHVILRGLWIGALGLRYVSGDIDFEKLNYSDRFKNYLVKKIVSFDRYIASLEDYCSVLFAISFLLIFYLLAFFLVNSISTLILGAIFDNEFLPEWLQITLGIPIALFFAIGILLTFFDFITQGLLKKNKWVSKIYFPFYWVFSFLTLSFLYRPLIYNFLDNKFGKRLILLLVPVYILILVASSLTYQNSNFLNKRDVSSSNFANEKNYLDMLIDEDDYPGNVAIASKVVRTPFLQVFVPYKKDIEDEIFSFNEKLKPEKDERGWTSDIVVSFNAAENELNPKDNDSIYSQYLETFNKMYTVKIDSLAADSKFIVTTSSQGILGFESYISLNNLSEGKHEFNFKRLHKKDSITNEATIPLSLIHI